MSGFHVKMRAALRTLLGHSRIVALASCILLPASTVAVSASQAPDTVSIIEAAVVMDSYGETALFGFDPVAYYTEGKARLGKPQHAIVRDNQVWRFASEANMAAFIANPEAFLPAFGGHDPVSIAGGFLTSGDPEYFLMLGKVVLLFRSADSRQRFIATPELLAQAKKSWPEVYRENAFH
jgi:hypothetical protein